MAWNTKSVLLECLKSGTRDAMHMVTEPIWIERGYKQDGKKLKFIVPYGSFRFKCLDNFWQQISKGNEKQQQIYFTNYAEEFQILMSDTLKWNAKWIGMWHIYTKERRQSLVKQFFLINFELIGKNDCLIGLRSLSYRLFVVFMEFSLSTKRFVSREVRWARGMWVVCFDMRLKCKNECFLAAIACCSIEMRVFNNIKIISNFFEIWQRSYSIYTKNEL